MAGNDVAYVYVWNKDNQGGVGHASVQIPGAYCSFWPGGEGYGMRDVLAKERVASENMESYVHDTYGEGRPYVDAYGQDQVAPRDADKVIEVRGLDGAAMLAKWNEIKNDRYSFGDRNCAATVADILKAGSGLQPDFPVRAYPGDYIPSEGISNKGLNRYLAQAVTSTLAKGANVAAIATKQHKVWTPEAAGRFAEGLTGRIVQHQAQLAQQQAELAQKQARREQKQAQREAMKSPKRRSSQDSDGSSQSYHSARSHLSDYNQPQDQNQVHYRR
jgi:hypothetical protein